MQFDAFDSFADTTLEFPLSAEKVYVAPVPDFDTGARITRIVTGQDTDSAGKPEEWLWELLLGPVYAEMIADRVPHAFLRRAGQTALQHVLGGRDAAVKMWREGPDPLAVAAALQAAQSSAASKPSPSTGGANRTQRRASSKATTSPKS